MRARYAYAQAALLNVPYNDTGLNGGAQCALSINAFTSYFVRGLRARAPGERNKRDKKVARHIQAHTRPATVPSSMHIPWHKLNAKCMPECVAPQRGWKIKIIRICRM